MILRTIYMLFCGFFAAMLPFFGDINAVVGAVGFIPLDFILPMLLYNMTFKPPRSSLTYWTNVSIMVVFTCAGLLGAFSSIRQLALDASQFKLFSSTVVNWRLSISTIFVILHKMYANWSLDTENIMPFWRAFVQRNWWKWKLASAALVWLRKLIKPWHTFLYWKQNFGTLWGPTQFAVQRLLYCTTEYKRKNVFL